MPGGDKRNSLFHLGSACLDNGTEVDQFQIGSPNISHRIWVKNLSGFPYDVLVTSYLSGLDPNISRAEFAFLNRSKVRTTSWTGLQLPIPITKRDPETDECELISLTTVPRIFGIRSVLMFRSNRDLEYIQPKKPLIVNITVHTTL